MARPTLQRLRAASRNGSLISIGQTLVTNLLIQGLNLATGVITARLLQPSGRGELAAIIMWPQFLGYLCTLGVPVSLVYFMKKQPERQGSHIGAAVVLSAVMSVVAMAIGVVGIPFWLGQYPETVVRFAQWCMLATPLTLIGTTLLIPLQAREAFIAYNRLRYWSPLLVLIALVGLLATGALTVHRAALAYLLAPWPIVAGTLIWVMRHARPNLDDVRNAGRQLLGYGLRVWGTDLLGTLATQIDRLLVVAMLSAHDMGLYVVAQSVSRVLGFISSAIVPVLLPRAAAHDAAQGLRLVRRAAVLGLALMIIAALPIVLFGRIALQWVYGPEFASASLLLDLLAAETVVTGTAWILSQALLGANRPGTLTALQGASVAMLVPLLYWAGSHFGLTGIGAALLGAALVRLALVVLVLGRHSPVSAVAIPR